MTSPLIERQARRKVRIATKLLADAVVAYDQAGHVYDRPALNAEILRPIVEELMARITEAERLAPLIG